MLCLSEKERKEWEALSEEEKQWWINYGKEIEEEYGKEIFGTYEEPNYWGLIDMGLSGV